ncbi:MAG: hypothetical protein KJ905_01000 [Nanoarchaeota archaeon]|nr:hypothetical protein [Nanoarchaeota archaeon]MBU1501337.1 hypothetical protein [Nanoarchaeota archaeon]MBU2459316.1 hypothetical protein [Nanoarchaeota archaeon]
MKPRTLLTILALGFMTACGREEKTSHEFYQGYNETIEPGKTIYVFDDLPLHLRENPAKFKLEGNSSLKKKLEIGERYKFKHREPFFSFNHGSIVKILPDTSHYSRERLVQGEQF